MLLKLSWMAQLLAAFYACPSLGFHHEVPRSVNQKPTRSIANVTVIDTPLVRAAQDMARRYSEDHLFNHVMRTWLFGALVISHNTTLQQAVDLEVHAIGSLLHDLGLVLNASFISPNLRFEVDGAFAATNFVEDQVTHTHNSVNWDANRLQLLWDSIAMSSEFAIALYKQATVAAVVYGVGIDLTEPSRGVTNAEYNNVLAAFPKLDFISAVNQTFIKLCVQKPNSTYDTWQQAFGDAFVPGYSAVGHRIVDFFK